MNIQVIVIIIIIAVGIATIYVMVENKQGKMPAINQTGTTTNPKTENTITTATSSLSETLTTTPTSSNNTEKIWNLVFEFTGIRLTHTTEPHGDYPPVLINGTFYDFSSAKLFFNYTIGNKSIIFNASWSIENKTYKAVCHDFVHNNDIAKITKAYMIEYYYNFGNGYWIKADIYIPENSTMLDFLNTLPFVDLAAFATPHGAQKMVLGAIFRSSDPNSNGEWTSAQPLLSEDQMAMCHPKVRGSPEADSLNKVVEDLVLNHNVAFQFMPFEFQDPKGLLDQVNKTIEGYGSTTVYEKYYFKVEPIGPGEYPGTGINTTIYNVTFWTRPDYVHGYYLIIAESIIPIEYHAIFPNGDNLGGIPVTVTIKLISAQLTPYYGINTTNS